MSYRYLLVTISLLKFQMKNYAHTFNFYAYKLNSFKLYACYFLISYIFITYFHYDQNFNSHYYQLACVHHNTDNYLSTHNINNKKIQSSDIFFNILTLSPLSFPHHLLHSNHTWHKLINFTYSISITSASSSILFFW